MGRFVLLFGWFGLVFGRIKSGKDVERTMCFLKGEPSESRNLNGSKASLLALQGTATKSTSVFVTLLRVHR